MFLLHVFVFCLLTGAYGNDVVLGILGMPAYIECQLPVSETLVWEIQHGGIIAMNGSPINENSTKYLIQKQAGFRESLVIHDVTLADDNVYRCHDFRNSSAVDSTELKVLGKNTIHQLSIFTRDLLNSKIGRKLRRHERHF